MDSRRDWNTPPDELVIKQARLEVLPDGSQYLDICVFSLTVLEQIRWARHRDAISASEAEGRATAVCQKISNMLLTISLLNSIGI